MLNLRLFAKDVLHWSMGRLVSDMVRPSNTDTDPLAALIAAVRAETRASGLTDDDIDAELTAYNAERRL